MKKVDIKTGFMCNNNCRFCVQADNKNLGNRGTDAIKKDLDDALQSGCTGVVFTGGEITLRDDLVELVAYAKKKGFEQVQLQSNSRMMASMPYIRALVKAGANDFAPALHGHTAELHDYLTRAPGSFNQTTQAIRNMKTLGMRTTSNTVVVKPNYRHLPDIARLLVKLGVDQYQFAFVHACGNAKTYYEEMMPRVSDAASFIKRGLQIGIDHGKVVMAEAMPMCHMEGYEKYCSEWFIPDTEIRHYDSYDPDFAHTRRTEGKKKFPQCRKCVHDHICEGPWKEYPEKMGDSEFVPVTHTRPRPRTTLFWTLYDYTPYDEGDDLHPNLGIAYISSVLESNNFPVTAIESNQLAKRWGYKNINTENMQELLGKLVWVTEKTNPDILAIGFWSEGVTFVKKFVEVMRQRNPDLIIVLGGTLSTVIPDRVAKFIPQADYLVQGDAEFTMLELAKATWKKVSTKNILGLSRLKNGKLLTNAARPPMELDKLPLMDFENFVYRGKGRGLHIVTSRGCPNRCSYCAIVGTHKTVRFHSVDYIMRQIRHLTDLYDLQYITFSDDNFMCNEPRTAKLLKALIENDFGIDFPASSRIENLNLDICRLIKPARISWLSIGVENMVPKVLQYFNRVQGDVDYRPMIMRTMENLKQYTNGGAFSFIYGSPVETKADVEHNIEWIEKISNNGFRIYSSALRIVAGSSIWNDYTSGRARAVRRSINLPFPFDQKYSDLVWAVPVQYVVGSNHYSDEETLNMIEETGRRIGEIESRV